MYELRSNRYLRAVKIKQTEKKQEKGIKNSCIYVLPAVHPRIFRTSSARAQESRLWLNREKGEKGEEEERRGERREERILLENKEETLQVQGLLPCPPFLYLYLYIYIIQFILWQPLTSSAIRSYEPVRLPPQAAVPLGWVGWLFAAAAAATHRI